MNDEQFNRIMARLKGIHDDVSAMGCILLVATVILFLVMLGSCKP